MHCILQDDPTVLHFFISAIKRSCYLNLRRIKLLTLFHVLHPHLKQLKSWYNYFVHKVKDRKVNLYLWQFYMINVRKSRRNWIESEITWLFSIKNIYICHIKIWKIYQNNIDFQRIINYLSLINDLKKNSKSPQQVGTVS